MKNVVLAFIMACFTAGLAFGQNPTFGRYPAKVERAKARAIDFRNSPGASTFRTRLREALKGGVNFAGHYILTGWGCGTGCTNGAVIDARTGRVYFPKELAGVAVWFGRGPDENFDTFEFRKDSRLLIIRGIAGPMEEDTEDVMSKQGTYFYQWIGTRFRLIKFVPDESRKDGE